MCCHFSIHMLGCAVLVGVSCWLGFELVSLLVGKWFDPVVVLGFGMPIGIVMMGWMFFIANLYWEFSVKMGLVGIGILVGIALCLRYLNRLKRKRKLQIDVFGFGACVVLPFLFLSYWVFTSILYKGDQVRHSVFGDLPFHLNIISSFVYGCNKKRKTLFDVVSPFFSDEPLAYPLLVDFISSIMVGCFGTSMQYSLVIPSFPFVFSLFASLNRIASTLTSEKIPQALAPWLFLLNGGIGFSATFDWKVIMDARADLVHGWGHDRFYFWFHIVHHILLPQRLSLFSMPMCWAYICLLINNQSKWQIFFLCGLIVALLPHVQGHSLICLFEFTLFYALLTFPWRSWTKMVQVGVRYLVLGIPALIIALPQLIPFRHRVSGTSFFQIKPLWSIWEMNPVVFWWKSLGVFAVLSLCHCWLVLNAQQILLYLPSLFLFAVSSVVIYQPWEMDNTKVFINGWLPFAVTVVAMFLGYLFQQRDKCLANFLAITLLLACTISGAIGLVKCGQLISSVWVSHGKEFDVGQWIIEHTDPMAVWLTEFTHNSPVAAIAGRQLLLGYVSWAECHNLDPKPRIKAVEEFSINVSNTVPLDRYNVEYICFEPERSNLAFSLEGSPAWMHVYSSNGYSVWKKR